MRYFGLNIIKVESIDVAGVFRRNLVETAVDTRVYKDDSNMCYPGECGRFGSILDSTTLQVDRMVLVLSEILYFFGPKKVLARISVRNLFKSD